MDRKRIVVEAEQGWTVGPFIPLQYTKRVHRDEGPLDHTVKDMSAECWAVWGQWGIQSNEAPAHEEDSKRYYNSLIPPSTAPRRCSEQGLWIIFSHQVMSSTKSSSLMDYGFGVNCESLSSWCARAAEALALNGEWRCSPLEENLRMGPFMASAPSGGTEGKAKPASVFSGHVNLSV